MHEVLTAFWIVILSGYISCECGPGVCSLDPFLLENCNIAADTSCPSDYCNNQGLCFHGRLGDKFCNCSEGFFGNMCQFSYQHDADFDCLKPGSNCLNGGYCQRKSLWQHVCACAPGFRGDRCELKTRTILQDRGRCQNGGTHYVQGDVDGCLCQCGFRGKYCEYISPEALSHIYCRIYFCNGNGLCARYKNSSEVFCYCFYGYSGVSCQNSNLHSSTRSGYHTSGIHRNPTEAVVPLPTTTVYDEIHQCETTPRGNKSGQWADRAVLTGYIVTSVFVLVVIVIVVYIVCTANRRKEASGCNDTIHQESSSVEPRSVFSVSNTGVNLSAESTITETNTTTNTNTISVDSSPSPVRLELPTYDEACEKPPGYSEAVTKFIVTEVVKL